MIVVAACAKLVARLVQRADRRAWMSLAVVVAVAMTQAQLLANMGIRLMSTPLDPELGIIPGDVSSLSGQTALCVGCTKGVGLGISLALREIGVDVASVGRSRSTFLKDEKHTRGYDLSTVAGCGDFSEALKKDGTVYDLVFFTIGAWPDWKDTHTSDGIERVFALDLLARHMLLSQLVKDDLLSQGAVIVNTLAPTQNIPFMSKTLIKHRLASVANTTKPPTSLFAAIFPIAIAADAWLPAAASHYKGLSFAAVFPGIVVSDLAKPALPAWAFRLYKAAIKPFAISALDSGYAHLAIAAAPQVKAKGVSYWNHLREGRFAHHLAYDPDLRLFVWDTLQNRSTITT